MTEALTVAARREAVAELSKNGLPSKIIAKRLSIPLNTVLSDKLHLSVPNPAELKNQTTFIATTASPTTDANRERRASVRKMFEDGLNDREIAEKLDVSVMTVKRDREAMELDRKAEIDHRRVQVKELLDQNIGQNEIAEQLGISLMTVIRDRKHLGFDDALEVRKSAIEIRRDKIRQMVEDGMPCTAIARKLGLGKHVVRYDCEQMGILDKATKSVYGMRARQRKEDIIEMYKTEPRVQKIADHFKVHPMTVKRALESQDKKTA